MYFLKDQRGQSLIQVVIGAGIMGIVVMGAMTMVTYQTRETKALAEVLAAMDLQKVLVATIADGDVCHHILNHPSQRTFDSTSVSPTNPQVLQVNRIPASTNATAPSVVEVGAKASSYSSSLEVSEIRLDIKEGAGNVYLADWVVDFDSSKTVRQVRPVTVSARLVVDRSTPTATRIIACQNGGTVSRAECNSDKRGEVRYNPSSDTMEFCNGHSWGTWNPPTSESQIKPGDPGFPCGADNKGFTAYAQDVYWLGNPFGGMSGPRRVCCYISSAPTGVSGNRVPTPSCVAY